MRLSSGSRALAKVVRHYLVGYDRPNPGQQKTMLPTGEFSELPGSDVAMVDFSRRLPTSTSSKNAQNVVLAAVPWHGLTLVGRFEKTLDSANPPRDVDHIHVMLLDLEDGASGTALSPMKIADKFITAGQYSLLPNSFDEFYKSLSGDLMNGTMGLDSGSPVSETVATGENVVANTKRLIGAAGKLPIHEVDQLLNQLPADVANRIAWAVDGSDLASVPTVKQDSEDEELIADALVEEVAAQLIEEEASQRAARLFDLFFPVCSIELAVELANEFSGNPDTNHGTNDIFFTSATAQLIKKGYAPDRLVETLIGNAVYLDRKYGPEVISLISTGFSGLFQTNKQSAITDLGFPYLVSLIVAEHEVGSEKQSTSEEPSLMAALNRDKQFQSFKEEIQTDPTSGIRKILDGTSEHLEHGFMYAITNFDTNIWVERIRDILLATEDGSTGEIGSLVALTDLVINFDDREFADRWFDDVPAGGEFNFRECSGQKSGRRQASTCQRRSARRAVAELSAPYRPE